MFELEHPTPSKFGHLFVCRTESQLAGNAGVLCVAICLPSLYIFICLNGTDARLRQVAGVLVAAVCLTALLLISFAPIVWVFSQSTDSVLLMAFLHLVFWAVALFFGLRLLCKGTSLFSASTQNNLTPWLIIYVFVSLQMMTALRPIIGKSDTFLPQKKEFFLNHFLKLMIPQPQRER